MFVMQEEEDSMKFVILWNSAIRTAFARNEHFISVFFDLESAYGMAWRGGIVRDLHDIGMRGPFPKFITEFLKRRKFQVKIGNRLSNEYDQQNGVP